MSVVRHTSTHTIRLLQTPLFLLPSSKWLSHPTSAQGAQIKTWSAGANHQSEIPETHATAEPKKTVAGEIASIEIVTRSETEDTGHVRQRGIETETGTGTGTETETDTRDQVVSAVDGAMSHEIATENGIGNLREEAEEMRGWTEIIGTLGVGGRGRGDKDRERGDRKRPREEDGDRRASRSRSPARDARAHLSAERSPAPAKNFDIDPPRGPKSRTATPPVAFKVGPGAQAHPGAGHPNGHLHNESLAHSRGHTPAAYDSEAMDADVPVHDDTATSKSKGKAGKQTKIEEKNVEEDEDIVIEEDDSMAAMQAMLGFGGFGTTKQKKVVGNDVYAVRKEKKTEYRQYMNRVGGFNRPLSPSRD